MNVVVVVVFGKSCLSLSVLWTHFSGASFGMANTKQKIARKDENNN